MYVCLFEIWLKDRLVRVFDRETFPSLLALYVFLGENNLTRNKNSIFTSLHM